jgi:hypothetical protein
MRVAVKNDVDIFRRAFRWNVDEAKSHAVSFQIDYQRPFGIAVAISPHDRDGRPDILERFEKTRRADIAQMPDFIRARRQRIDVGGQMIVGVGQDKDAKGQRHF